MKKKPDHLIWYSKDKKVISCDETNKVLNENYLEMVNIIQSCYDDAILMGCGDQDFKDKIMSLTDNLEFSLGKKY